MKDIKDNSINLILADLPYGTTKLKWDSVLPLDKLWEQYNRIIKDNGAIVLFGQEPFASNLRSSNFKNYKYDWVWLKNKPTNFFQLKRRPGKDTENIMVFYKKQCTYHPQMRKHEGKPVTNATNKKFDSDTSGSYKGTINQYHDSGLRYPSTVIEFSKVYSSKMVHPTQKPVELLEYLIKTYTDENDIVLDNTMGSGSTGVAAVNLNRNFIGMELDENYFNIAKGRIDVAEKRITGGLDKR